MFFFFALVQHVQPLCLQWSLAQLFPATWVGGISQWSVFISLMSMVNLHLQNKVVGDKGISEIKSKQQNPCSNCMHQPVMSWNNACSTCMHKPVSCMHQPVMSQANACTYCMGSKVSSLSRIYLYSSYFVFGILFWFCRLQSQVWIFAEKQLLPTTRRHVASSYTNKDKVKSLLIFLSYALILQSVVKSDSRHIGSNFGHLFY